MGKSIRNGGCRNAETSVKIFGSLMISLEVTCIILAKSVYTCQSTTGREFPKNDNDSAQISCFTTPKNAGFQEDRPSDTVKRPQLFFP